MENGIFISLTGYLLNGPEAFMLATVVGLIGTPVVLLAMPLRGLWAVYQHFNAAVPGRINRPRLYYSAFVLLALSAYSLLEVVFFFFNARGGEVSGVMIPMLSLVPFVFYLCFEIMLAFSRIRQR